MTTGTFGKTTAGSSSSASSTNKMSLSKFTAPATGRLHVAHAHLWLSAAGSFDAAFVVYSDNAGVPNALLGQSDIKAGNTNTADAVLDFAFTGGDVVDVVNGTSYWFGPEWSDPGTPSVNVGRDSGALQRVEVTLASGFGFPPDPFVSGTTLSGPAAAWVEYENRPTDGKLYATHPETAYGLAAVPTDGVTDGTAALNAALDFVASYWTTGTVVLDGAAASKVLLAGDVVTPSGVSLLVDF